MNNLIIGIDPDVDKNGVAIYTNKSVELKSLKMFELMDYLIYNKANIKLVKIEGGWMNKTSNFHAQQGARQRELIAKHVGENQRVGKVIVEMCEYIDLPYKIIKPLKKIWKGPNKKITHNELTLFLKGQKIDLKKPRTNQEERDACLLAIIG